SDLPSRAASVVVVPLESLPGVGGTVNTRDADAEVRQARDLRVTEIPVGAPQRADHAMQGNELRFTGSEVVPPASLHGLLVGEDALLDRWPGNIVEGDGHVSRPCCQGAYPACEQSLSGGVGRCRGKRGRLV